MRRSRNSCLEFVPEKIFEESSMPFHRNWDKPGLPYGGPKAEVSEMGFYRTVGTTLAMVALAGVLAVRTYDQPIVPAEGFGNCKAASESSKNKVIEMIKHPDSTLPRTPVDMTFKNRNPAEAHLEKEVLKLMDDASKQRNNFEQGMPMHQFFTEAKQIDKAMGVNLNIVNTEHDHDSGNPPRQIWPLEKENSIKATLAYHLWDMQSLTPKQREYFKTERVNFELDPTHHDLGYFSPLKPNEYSLATGAYLGTTYHELAHLKDYQDCGYTKGQGSAYSAFIRFNPQAYYDEDGAPYYTHKEKNKPLYTDDNNSILAWSSVSAGEYGRKNMTEDIAVLETRFYDQSIFNLFKQSNTPLYKKSVERLGKLYDKDPELVIEIFSNTPQPYQRVHMNQ